MCVRDRGRVQARSYFDPGPSHIYDIISYSFCLLPQCVTVAANHIHSHTATNSRMKITRQTCREGDQTRTKKHNIEQAETLSIFKMVMSAI